MFFSRESVSHICRLSASSMHNNGSVNLIGKVWAFFSLPTLRFFTLPKATRAGDVKMTTTWVSAKKNLKQRGSRAANEMQSRFRKRTLKKQIKRAKKKFSVEICVLYELGDVDGQNALFKFYQEEISRLEAELIKKETMPSHHDPFSNRFSSSDWPSL